MKTKTSGLHPAAWLKMGTAVLSAAQVVDITSVKPRLAAFAKAYRSYLQAHGKVEAAEAKLGAAEARLAELDVLQDEAVEALARSLVNDGKSRRNPFADFASLTASDIKKLPCAEEAKAIHKLVAAVQADQTASPATGRASRTAEQAAKAIEAALVPLDKLRASARTAREAREHVEHICQNAFSALKRSARAADDDGGPAVSTALFGGLRRAKAKKAEPAPVAEPVAQPVAKPGSDGSPGQTA